jgi:hypothetical protein
MRATAFMIAASLAVACASSMAPGAVEPAPQPPATVFAAGDGVDVRLSSAGRTIEDVVYAPVAEAWPALLLAFEALNIPIAERDDRNHTLRSRGHRMASQIEGRRRSELLDCGSTMTGLRADTWDITVEIVAGLRQENPARTQVATLITAVARPREGTSNSPVSCQSKGELEKIIVRQLAEHTEP